jgi:hypothetical protein
MDYVRSYFSRTFKPKYAACVRNQKSLRWTCDCFNSIEEAFKYSMENHKGKELVALRKINNAWPTTIKEKLLAWNLHHAVNITTESDANVPDANVPDANVPDANVPDTNALGTKSDVPSEYPIYIHFCK